jgi:hypothetical protein
MNSEVVFPSSKDITGGAGLKNKTGSKTNRLKNENAAFPKGKRRFV